MSFYFEIKRGRHGLKLIELRQRAESGDVSCQYELGDFLVYHAEGGPKEKLVSEGVRWLKMASDRGHCPAIERLASVYLSGVAGVEIDEQEGMRLTWIAAGMGSGGAVQTLAYHFAYGTPPDLVKGYAYFKLREYVTSQTGYSTEIARDNMDSLRGDMGNDQLAEAEELFVRLRDELETKPFWKTYKAEMKKESDRRRYPRLMEMYAEASQHADAYPEELARVKGYIDELEAIMDRADMIEIRAERTKVGLPNSPETLFNKPERSGRGCVGLVVAAFLLVGGVLSCLLIARVSAQ